MAKKIYNSTAIKIKEVSVFLFIVLMGNCFTLSDLHAQCNTNPGYSLNMPDSVFENSPAQISLNVIPGSASVQTSWYVNDSKVEEGYELTQIFQDQDTLEIVNQHCSGNDTIERIIDVYAPTQSPEPDFIASENSIAPYKTIQLKDVSANGPSDWYWEVSPALNNGAITYLFGNGGSDSTASNPDITFLQPGYYEICLTVSNSFDPGGQTICRSQYIYVGRGICQGSNTATDSFGVVGGEEERVSGQTCEFLIQPCASSVNIRFDELNLSDNETFLQIYDGSDNSGEPLWDLDEYGGSGYTGDTTHAGFERTLTANSGSVFIEYNVGSDAADSGFQLQWEATGDSLASLSPSLTGDSTLCEGFTSTFQADADLDDVSFNWYLDSSLTEEPDAVGESFDVTLEESGYDTITLITRQCRRVDTIQKVIQGYTPITPPKVDFETSSQFVQPGDSIQLTDLSSSCITGNYWEISPGSYEFVRGTDSLTENPWVRFTDTGSYDVTLVDTNEAGVADTTKIGYIRSRNYCDPQVENTHSDLAINRVNWSNLENASGLSNDGYSKNYEFEPAKLVRGASPVLTIQRNTALNRINYKVWIDFDLDGKFNDSNELVAESGAIFSREWEKAVSLSQNLATGIYPMRIGASLNDLSNRACGPNLYGEFEDYLVEIVEDDVPPVVHLQGGDTLSVKPCQSLANIDTGTYAMDNVDGRINQVQVRGTVDTSEPGYDTLFYEAEDQVGNVSEKMRILRIEADEMPPQFSLNGPDTFRLAVNHTFQDPSYAQVKDACPGVDTVKVNSNVVDTALGAYQVEYRAVDLAGNDSVLTRVVKVADTIAPSVALNGPANMELEVDSTFEDPGISYSDNYWDSTELIVNVDQNINTNELGTYTVEYRVKDSAGNQIAVERKVTVVDDLPPSIEKLASDTFEHDVYTNLQLEGKVTVDDNVGEPELIDTVGSYFREFEDGRAAELGYYGLGLVYGDGKGNIDTASFTVEVVDNAAPSIELKGAPFVSLQRWDSSAYANKDSVEVEDNYYSREDIEVKMAGSYFTEYLANDMIDGMFDIAYWAVDSAGNQSPKITRTVEVLETTGMNEESKADHLAVYPNPADEELFIEFGRNGATSLTFKLLNGVGQEVREISFDGEESKETIKMNVEQLKSGVYFLRMRNANKTKTQKLIIE